MQKIVKGKINDVQDGLKKQCTVMLNEQMMVGERERESRNENEVRVHMRSKWRLLQW